MVRDGIMYLSGPGGIVHVLDGAALYSNTTLAIRPTTGEVVWYQQTIPGETHDLDDLYESVVVDRGNRRSLFKVGKIGILRCRPGSGCFKKFRPS